MIYPISHHYFLYGVATWAALATAKFGYDHSMPWMYIFATLELLIPITCYSYTEGRNDTWKKLIIEEKFGMNVFSEKKDKYR